MEKLFERVRKLWQAGELECDRILSAWLQGPVDQLPLKTYLDADDTIFQYPIRFWSEHSDAVLADLARRYLDRDLFKARSLSDLDPHQQQELHQLLQTELERKGLDPDSYLGLHSAHARGYTLYHEGIHLKGDGGYREIAELSGLVRSLTQTAPTTRIIFPREVEETVAYFLQESARQKARVGV